MLSKKEGAKYKTKWGRGRAATLAALPLGSAPSHSLGGKEGVKKTHSLGHHYELGIQLFSGIGEDLKTLLLLLLVGLGTNVDIVLLAAVHGGALVEGHTSAGALVAILGDDELDPLLLVAATGTLVTVVDTSVHDGDASGARVVLVAAVLVVVVVAHATHAAHGNGRTRGEGVLDTLARSGCRGWGIGDIGAAARAAGAAAAVILLSRGRLIRTAAAAAAFIVTAAALGGWSTLGDLVALLGGRLFGLLLIIGTAADEAGQTGSRHVFSNFLRQPIVGLVSLGFLFQ